MAYSERFIYLSKLLYAITNTRTSDINPYPNVNLFLQSKVKTLLWGKGNAAQRNYKWVARSMTRICNEFDINLDFKTIYEGLSKKGDSTFEELISSWEN